MKKKNLYIYLTLAVLIVSTVFIFVNKDNEMIQESPNKEKEFVPYTEETKFTPIEGPVTMDEWISYSNQKHNFSIDVPENSLIGQENFNTGISDYTRIQNYTSDVDITSHGGINEGEYFVEIHAYPLVDANNSLDNCLLKFDDYEQLDDKYVGYLKAGGGETAASVYGLCIVNDGLLFDVNVSENEELYAEEIINSFKFN